MPPFLTCGQYFENGDNDEVGSFLKRYPNHWNDIEVDFAPAGSNLKNTVPMSTGALVPCGEYLMHCLGKARFAVLSLAKPENISYFGCSPADKELISKDIQGYLSTTSNMIGLLFSAHKFQTEVARSVPEQVRIAAPSVPEQVRIAAPPATRMSDADLDKLLEARQAEKEAERRALAEREAAGRLADECRRLAEQVQAMKLADNQRQLEEKRKEDEAKTEQTIQKLKDELEQLKQNQNLRDDAARSQNQVVVRREEGGRGIDSDRILFVVVLLAAVFFMHTSYNTRMDTMATKTENDLHDLGQSHSKTVSTLNYYMHERARNMEYEMFEKRHKDTTKKTEESVAKGGVTWILFGVAVVVMILTIILRQNFVYYIDDAHYLRDDSS
jgi:hypothetical protein